MIPRLVVATHNKGKLHEFADLLRPYVTTIVSAGDLGLPEPEETGTSFAENAILKARAAALATGSLALADDSGLCVNTLNGEPGIYSGRWAEIDGKRDFPAAMKRLHVELGARPDRTAYFIAVLALCWPDGRTECVEGRINGTIAHQARGTDGHGYDPIFVPAGETRSFAEMTSSEKNAISHRAIAAKIMIEKFFA